MKPLLILKQSALLVLIVLYFSSSLNAQADSLILRTYLGSNEVDIPNSILKYKDKYIVCGSTYYVDSIPFPGIDLQNLADSSLNIHISVLSSDLETLYETFVFGGSQDDLLAKAEIVGDSLYLFGNTMSDDFPTSSNSYQALKAGQRDAFLSIFDLTTENITYSTYIGGADDDFASSFVLSQNKEFYGLLNTKSSDLPSFSDSEQNSNLGNLEVYVFQMDSSLTSVNHSTYLGAEEEEMGTDLIIVDSSLHVLVNASVSLLANRNPIIHTDSVGNGDVLLIEYDYGLHTISTSHVIGGDQFDLGSALRARGSDIMITGQTFSPNFVLKDTMISSVMADTDLSQAFLSVIDSSADSLLSSNIIGGTQNEYGANMIVFENYIYWIGTTSSSNFPKTVQYDADSLGQNDLFVVLLDTTYSFLGSTCFGGPLNEGGRLSLLDGYSTLEEFVSQNDFENYITQGVSLSADTTYLGILHSTYSPFLDVQLESVDEIHNGFQDEFIQRINGSNNFLCNAPGFGGSIPSQILELCLFEDTCISVETDLEAQHIKWFLNGLILSDDNVFSGTNSLTLCIHDAPQYLHESTLICSFDDTFHYYITFPLTIFIDSYDLELSLTNSNLDLCPGDSILLQPQGASSYQWSNGEEEAEIWFAPSHGETIQLIGTNEKCGVDSLLIAPNVFPAFGPVSINVSDTLICQGQSIIVTGGGTDSLLFIPPIWDSLGIETPVTDTEYIVYGFDTFGCVISDTSFVKVFETPVLDPIVEHETCEHHNNGSINLNLQSPKTVDIFWQHGSNDEYITDLDSGTYNVLVVNSDFCTAEQSFEIINLDSDCEYNTFVPNMFSPNNDGKNDVLHVRGFGIDSFSFLLFDQRGNQVFSTSELSIGWPGQIKGGPAELGVYYYELKGNYRDGNSFYDQGNITLLR